MPPPTLTLSQFEVAAAAPHTPLAVDAAARGAQRGVEVAGGVAHRTRPPAGRSPPLTAADPQSGDL
eukprot:CAMPEP_0114425462 /NCGR_PEP_ID=MMETSP0103-20121206/7248_1 /TAXON_ID=37642 ORGANISM="Paraphysomonas imperforata, Strain PA2" /NCGR_SAMPLE_ID=MMETSP0103 /ASSEMBLY_ACC=CAM_ASM_000201 /LENGTH=65 /DNA_ID=CAMNT_0001594299 /DNA_START=147 /DNA_END=344 /DNA_ORIENTATION=-